ncbi:hypothetical protein BK634_02855 [Pseudomonas chlororaphis]|jgi:hypothetical protein|nr:hypothetical protein BK634_02855 [Pseudomonas chlororaphis]
MVPDKAIAQATLDLYLDVLQRVDQHLADTLPHLDDGQARAYKLATGKVMGEIIEAFLNPLIRQHPELKPEQLD